MVAATLAVGTAHAANMQLACESQIVTCVYVHNNKVVGIFQQSPPITGDIPNIASIALRQINNGWYQINVVQDGLDYTVGSQSGDFIYYTSSNCTGQQFIVLGEEFPRSSPPVPVVQTAYWDGQTLWAAAAQGETTASVLYANFPQCTAVLNGTSQGIEYVIGPAVKIETPSFASPFAVR